MPGKPMLLGFIPPQRFNLLPIISGTAWFLTLLIMLLVWLGKGRPRYPFQRDPEVAFISDIGAHEHIKPVFIAGGSITAIFYSATIFAANTARYHNNVTETKATRILANIALSAGVVASVTCIALTIFDTDRWHKVHSPLLMVTFLGIGISGICTVAVYWDVASGKNKGVEGLRKFCLINLTFVILEILVTAAFLVCLFHFVKVAEGCLEWAIAFLGAGYIWSFVGIVRVIDEKAQLDDERRPLLDDE